jgi:L-asparaginase
VVVGEEVHAAARRVRKVHTQRLDAFRSVLGPVGVLDRGRVRFHDAPSRGPILRPRRLVTAVDLHVLAAGSDDALLRASLDRGARGLVLEGTGAGNVPPGALPGVRAALRARVPVVVAPASRGLPPPRLEARQEVAGRYPRHLAARIGLMPGRRPRSSAIRR